MKPSYLTFFMFIAVVFVSCMPLQVNEHDKALTADGAIEIASSEAERLGYDLDMIAVKASKYNKPWNEYLPKETSDEYYLERKARLEGREYWAVYYFPVPEVKGEIILGGDICIFVDARNGEIITNIRWK